MATLIADYEASKNGQVIYSGSLLVEAEENDESVKDAVAQQLSSIDLKYGGGVPDTVTVNSWHTE
ncbi:TPA: hypothetical protein L7W18_005505 [Klebsiella pneumoniae]|jgi:hypothetical protein|uniref:hypothetical protein n=1 Tax=Klebsiella pneumoniae TaxID=573 RepID=UPI000E2A7901|nr:hypothetical protein [Klebsiella pneumoniae]HCD1314896.1 hypothetical protein [Klebsiella pneumoniae subsp. pneumoniae]EIW5648763.1 hypothetical protein [Klebsiella pneumoniae]EJS3660144.1 hypothetical protein [Klebsiella pneumoniae]EKW0829872.1 hypothetical protein [Klebsiella pneumoniae]EKW4992990.1 hypothetical protein [Klebsiella pneumoniae]